MKELAYYSEFHWTQSFELWMIKGCFAIFFLSIALFVMWQKKDFVYVGAPDQARWRDLRIWALLLLGIQTGLYLYL